jgi:nicotinamide riboside transporter PnuC
MRMVKIVAAIVASQCALGFVIGFTCPWLGFYVMHIGDVHRLLVWSIAVMAPFALAIDATAALAGLGFYIWRRSHATDRQAAARVG